MHFLTDYMEMRTKYEKNDKSLKRNEVAARATPEKGTEMRTPKTVRTGARTRARIGRRGLPIFYSTANQSPIKLATLSLKCP